MIAPQAGRAIAVSCLRGRGKSALHRARRRTAPGAGRLLLEPTCRIRATETNRLHLRGWGQGWKGGV